MTVSDERIAEILAQLDAWLERHRAHDAGCGCNPYQDVIYGLPEYDPEDPRNLAVPEQLDEYVLSDGTVIDGERDGWAVHRSDRTAEEAGQLLEARLLDQVLDDLAAGSVDPEEAVQRLMDGGFTRSGAEMHVDR